MKKALFIAVAAALAASACAQMPLPLADQTAPAQAPQLPASVELEVTQSFQAVKEADFALVSSKQQVASAEEAYRVARELFVNGRATSTPSAVSARSSRSISAPVGRRCGGCAIASGAMRARAARRSVPPGR